MTGDEFRELALSLFGTVEMAHMGHPDFRVRGKIFATLDKDEVRGMVKLTPEQQAGFVRAEAKVYVSGSGAWGRQGCTMVQLSSAKTLSVERALKMAWRNVVEKPAKTPAPRKAASTKAAPTKPSTSKAPKRKR